MIEYFLLDLSEEKKMFLCICCYFAMCGLSKYRLMKVLRSQYSNSLFSLLDGFNHYVDEVLIFDMENLLSPCQK